ETPFYGIGMKIYDLLAGQYGFGRSRIVSLEETLEKLPNLQRDGLRGGVVYYDGQFDDSRRSWGDTVELCSGARVDERRRGVSDRGDRGRQGKWRAVQYPSESSGQC